MKRTKKNKKKVSKVLKLLIVEFYPDESLYVYAETKKQYNKLKEDRKATGLTKRSLKSLRNDCKIFPGEYIVCPFSITNVNYINKIKYQS